MINFNNNQHVYWCKQLKLDGNIFVQQLNQQEYVSRNRFYMLNMSDIQ